MQPIRFISCAPRIRLFSHSPSHLLTALRIFLIKAPFYRQVNVKYCRYLITWQNNTQMMLEPVTFLIRLLRLMSAAGNMKRLCLRRLKSLRICVRHKGASFNGKTRHFDCRDMGSIPIAPVREEVQNGRLNGSSPHDISVFHIYHEPPFSARTILLRTVRDGSAGFVRTEH